MMSNEIAHGIFVVGGVEPADERLSWVAPGADGFLPINAYLILRDSDAILIDTGVAAHEQVILDDLRRLLPAGTQITIVVTRSAEFDSIGNVTAILRAFPVARIYARAPSAASFQMDPEFDIADGELSAPPLRCTPVPEGASIPMDHGQCALEVIDPPLRLLQTWWLYDSSAQILFTSDAFSHMLLATPAQPRLLTETVGMPDLEASLEPKFGWLRDADVHPTLEGLARVFAEREVQAIAPGMGRILVGRDVVAQHRDAVTELISRWGERHAD
jgi:flavorubredoxin